MMSCLIWDFFREIIIIIIIKFITLNSITKFCVSVCHDILNIMRPLEMLWMRK